MDNRHLFDLINTTAAAGSARLVLAVLLSKWLVYVVIAGWIALWVRGSESSRIELLHLLLAVLIAVPASELIRYGWPQPRPGSLGVGTQYLGQARDAGLPSSQVTIIWTLALRALGTRSLAVWCFPLLAAGLILGICLVYVGADFPFDIFAAFPLALGAAVVAWALRGPWRTVARHLLSLYERSVAACRRGVTPPPN